MSGTFSTARGDREGRGGAEGRSPSSTYITLQLLLRRGLAEPSRADHFAAAHGARLSGSRDDGRGTDTDTDGACGARRGRDPAVSWTGRPGRARSSLSNAGPPTRAEAQPAGAENSPASVQCARLGSVRAPRDSAPTRSRSLVPCAPPPRDRTSPERFPKATQRCHTHTNTHTQCPRAVPSPVRLLSVSVRPARSCPRRGRVAAPGAGEAGRRKEAAKLRRPAATRASPEPPREPPSRRRGAGRRRSCRRVGLRWRPPGRAGSGEGTRRRAAQLQGGSRCPVP